MTDAQPPASRNQSLGRGLTVLRMLVDADEPLTGTEVARRLGVHQSSASRILATLSSTGYVRKDSSGRYVPDYGVFALASAASKAPLLRTVSKPALQFVRDYPQLMLAMAILYHDEMIYLLRVRHGLETLTFWSGTFPMSASSLGLRLLLDLPEQEALDILRASRRRSGWGGNPKVVPATEQGVLAKTRKLLRDDALILDRWYRPDHISGAIVVNTPEPHPVALALVDETGGTPAEKLRILLHQARRGIEQSF